jgi:hypothetical protein
MDIVRTLIAVGSVVGIVGGSVLIFIGIKILLGF